MIQENMLGWTKNTGHTGRYDFSCVWLVKKVLLLFEGMGSDE